MGAEKRIFLKIMKEHTEKLKQKMKSLELKIYSGIFFFQENFFFGSRSNFLYISG